MKTRYIFLANLFILSLFLFPCCQNRPGTGTEVEPVIDTLLNQDLEAREDSIEMVNALFAQSKFKQKVTADVETEPVASAEEEDAADDPAIWYNTADPTKSLVLGTDKKAGIYLYDLEGKVAQFMDVGRINNVDLRDGFIYKGKEVVLVAGSNRSINCVTLFYLDKETGILSDSLLNIPSGVDEVYGLCVHKNKLLNEFHVFVNGKGGMLEQWNITVRNNVLEAELLRSIMMGSQPEGMVADDRYGTVYLGVEEEGIYKLDTDPKGDTLLQLMPGSNNTNPNIVYDVEGLALFSYKSEEYLIASIQGNFSYAIFKIGETEDQYITSIVIEDGTIDGVEETDGLEIMTLPLNETFKEGMFVVQDGFNTYGEEDQTQNFKYVSFSKIARILDQL